MSNSASTQIRERYENVLERIAIAAQSMARSPESVRLVVVTKAHSMEIVRAVVDAGARILGENYPEEALPKISALARSDVEWHMIGHIQSRKARQVCENFAWAHSLDREKIATRLNRFGGELGKRLPVLLECNISGEGSKFGYPLWKEENWLPFADQVAPLLELPSLDVRGLMTIPPWDPDPEGSRLYFQRLYRLRDYLAGVYGDAHWGELSMGMSNDYEVAIQEGATLVRVGTAIVGPRS